MSAIRVELELVDGTFTTRMLHAGQTVQQFNREVGNGYTAFKRAEEGETSFFTKLREGLILFDLTKIAFHGLSDASDSWVGKIIKVNAEIERTTFLLKGMSSAADPMKDAADQMKTLYTYAKQAPFSIKQLTDTYVKLKTTGIDPLKGPMQAVVDTVAAFGGNDEALHRVTIALQQMSGKGVIQMEELRQQLGEHIPRAVELMARSVGVSTAELIQQIQTGTVSAKETLAAFYLELERTYGGSAQAQMQTFVGRVSQIQTQFALLAKTVGDTGFYDTIKQQLGDIYKFLNSADAANMAVKLGHGLTTLTENFRSVIDWVIRFKDELFTGAKILAGFFAARMISSGVSTIVNGLRSIGTSLTVMRGQWEAAGTAAEVNLNRMRIGIMMGADPAAARFATTLRNVGIRAMTVGATIAEVATGPVGLLAVGLAELAMHFIDTRDHAKEAAAEILKFGDATDQTQLKLSKQRQQQLANEIADMRDSVRRQMQGYGKLAAKMGAGFFEDQVGLPDKLKEYEELAKKNAEAEKRLNSRELNANVSGRFGDIDEALSKLHSQYDKEAKVRDKAYSDEVTAYSKKNQDITALRDQHQKKNREDELKFYQNEYDLIQTFIDKQAAAVAAGDKDAIAVNEKYSAELIKRQRDVQERLVQTQELALGITNNAKPPKIQQMIDQAKKYIDSLNSKVAGHQAQLQGLDGDYAKIINLIDNAVSTKNGIWTQQNADLMKLRAQIVGLTSDYDALDAKLKGKQTLDRDINNELEKDLEKQLELQNDQVSGIDKIAAKLKLGMYSGQKPITILGQMFGDVTKAAGIAADTIQNKTFGPASIDRAQTMMDVVRGVASGFRDMNTAAAGAGRSVSNASRVQPGAGQRAFQTLMEQDPGAYTFLENLKRAEGNTKNPLSSADGIGQFIKSTWGQFLKEMHPEKMTGTADKPSVADLALRNDSKLADEAILWYARQNAGVLKKNDIPVTDANVYLAHLLGGQGAVAALKQSSDTMLRDIPALTKALESNPNLRNMNVGRLQEWSQSKFGNGISVGGFKGVSEDSLETITKALREGKIDAKEYGGLMTSVGAKIQMAFDGGDKAVKDYAAQLALSITKIKTADGALGKETNLAKLRAAIEDTSKSGKFTDHNFMADQYKGLRDAAAEADKQMQIMADHQRQNSKIKTFLDGLPAQMDALTEKEKEQADRLASGGFFKFSSGFEHDLITLTKMRDLILKMKAEGRAPEGADDTLSTIDDKIARQRKYELNEAILGERTKLKTIQESLMTADEARRDAMQKEIDRLDATLAEYKKHGLESVEFTDVIEKEKALIRQKYAQSDPISQQMKSWSDIGKNFTQSISNGLSSATDALATFITTGKADFSSLISSIATDFVKTGLHAMIGNMMTATGGSGKLAGGANKLATGGKLGVATHHAGGVAGTVRPSRMVSPAMFASAPRFHTGGFPGLKDSEIPIIAKKGEEVGWPEQLAKKYGGAGGLNQQINMPITVNASGGTPAQNHDLASQVAAQVKPMAQQLVTAEIARQMRPGGLIASGRR